MFNFQNLNGLFNLSPETLSQINQAAQTASVPTPTPSFTLPPNFNFGGMMQPAMETTAADSIVNPIEVQTDNSFAIPNVSLSNTDTNDTTVVDPAIAQTEAPATTGMFTGKQPETKSNTYNVAYSQESGEYQMFNDPSKMEIKQVTEDELREIYNEGGGHRKNTFGSFENFLAYTAEASDMLGNLDWWEAEGVDTRTGAQAMRDEEDVSTGGAQSSPDALVQSDPLARTSDYRQWIMSEENQSLMDKYGIQDSFKNDKGDIFEWTGSGYVKTYEAPRADFADYAKAALITATSMAVGNAAGAASGLGAIGSGAVTGGTTAAVSGGLSGNLSLQDVATGAVLGGLGGAMSELSKASQATQIETLEGMASQYQGVAGMEKTYQAVVDALDAVKAGKDFAEATVGLEDVIKGIQNVVNIVKDELPAPEIDPGRTVPGGTMTSDVTGEIPVDLPMPDYTVTPEEDSGGGGADSSLETVEEVTEQELAGKDPFEDTTETVEEVTNTGGQSGQYVYEGNGVFRDTVDGDLWRVPGELDFEVGDTVSEDYMVNSGATVAETPLGDETGVNTQEEEEGILDTGDFTFGGGSIVPTDTVKTVEPIETVEPVDTTEATDTTEDGDLTFGGGSIAVGTGTATETTGGTGDGTGTGEGSGSGTGTGDGDGDGDGDVSPSSVSSGGGAAEFKPFMSGISYQTPAIGELIQSPNVDYNAQLNAIINRNVGLFEGMV